MIDPLIPMTLQIFFAILLGTAAYSKFVHRETLEAVVENYRILPYGLVKPFAKLLPLVEGGLALALVAPIPVRITATLTVILLAVFTVAISVNVLRGRRFIDCGCFKSDLRQELSWWMVGRNGLMIALAMLMFLPQAERGMTFADGIMMVLISMTLWLMSFVPAIAGLKPPATYDDNFRASQMKR